MGAANQAPYLPSPRQIAEQCQAIRAKWTPAERKRRCMSLTLRQAERPWAPPRIDTTGCLARVRRVVLEQSA